MSWINKHPGQALSIYYKRGRTAAIKRNCLDCVGSAQEVTKCTATECVFWTMRHGADKGIWVTDENPTFDAQGEPSGRFETMTVPEHVPSQEALESLRDSMVSPERKEHARKLGESRKK